MYANSEVLDTSNLALTAIGERKVSMKRLSVYRPETTITITGQQLMEVFWKNENVLNGTVKSLLE